ncbi:MAG: PH domain-containing protein [Prevotellaceae bacterium]|jgi:hypothetical protein|nr:PH domain-containing protein [Prevotellaceae bacterium]
MIYQVNSPVDCTNVVVTLVALLIFSFCVFKAFKTSKIVGWITLMFVVSLSLFIYANVPGKITVNQEEITLHNILFDRKIKRNEILEVRLLSKDDRTGMWRKFASGGLFGYCGIYASKKHPTLYVYASQAQNWILITTANKKYVISPENTEIINILNKK